jgi:Tfp pilus assembly pilus retraction ATPase PilT
MNNIPAVANLIRTGKLEQLYTQLQTRTKDITTERMMSMERSLAGMVAEGIVSEQEAQKWANDRTSFADQMDRMNRNADRQEG